jgi:GntR family transcriptional regulator
MAKTPGPIYKKIARDLHLRISNDEFNNGGKMPTQKELAKKYNVAVLTIKQALSELAKEGLVSGVRGRGTFVRPYSYSYRMRFLSSLEKEIYAQHRELQTVLIEIKHNIATDLEIRELLRLKPEEEFVSYWRLRSIDGIPMIVQQSIVSAEHAKLIERSNLASTSLYSMLEKSGNCVIVSASENIQAVNLPSHISKFLDVKPQSVGLLSTRLSKNESGQPIILDYAYLPGDRAVIESDRFVGSDAL